MDELKSRVIKINLGCGRHLWADFINVDFENNASHKKPDVVADLRKLPFEDNYADEAHAIHVLEHFYPWEVEDVLKEWRRVLKPGGKLILEMPCLEKIIGHLNHDIIDTRLTLWGLFGDPKHKDPHMMHHWCYSIHMLDVLLTKCGFEDIRTGEPVFHKKERDMRCQAVKPCGS